ncbi:carboxylesterase/lipase family protein [Nonomuraea rhodomycinica]|uniref:Carboxylesterase family protein n=1 Tax=Nonomuraea rhodomycinica TaxID=1712872 RepID=A0A7Y6IIL7_9ACTN|nr:carboxylesterase family protein [Nonomuraea rhodomycinica]NUW38676.1 carboxylesterase family protein [Nonomuraea rhodomycinica]
MTTISTGRVSGIEEGGVTAFKGIPFARAPFGPLRFAAPEPAEPWDGVLEATRFGPRPPQPPMFMGMPAWDPAAGLDCLTVNVWTPDPGGSGLPVMVWIHGGAYRSGFADLPAYDGAHLAGRGVVVVTFNHRIGFEGYGHVEGAPDNRALLDQVAALRWVRENVAAFGGDPGNVTAFGQSAGAGAIACLLTMPMAEGLFRRAIAQSASSMFVTPAYASRVTAEVSRRLGGGSPRESAPEALVAAAEDVATQVIFGDPGRWGAMGYAGLAFAPVVDGEVLPDTPWNALAAGAARDVELVVGFTRDEFRLFGAMAGGRPVDLAGALETLAPDGAEEVYRRMRPEASDAELYEVLMSDWMFRMPSALLADAHTGTTYAYELTWSPTDAFRACHGLEVPLVFGNVGDDMATGLTGGSPDLPKVSEQFVTAWTGFAATGDPGWPRHDPATAVTHLFDASPSDAEDPEAASRALWSRTGFPVIG